MIIQQRQPHFQLSERLTPILLILGLIALGTPSPAAPEYALSGQTAELEQVILAETPMGALSALDLLIHDDQGLGILAGVPLEVWLGPGSLNAEPHLGEIHAAIANLVATEAVARRAGGWQPSEGRLRVMSFGAAIASWIQHRVEPRIQVTETDIDHFWIAHPEKYLNRRAAQVRYIFIRTPEGDALAMERAEERLESISTQVREGSLTFESAAQEHSDALSATDGGLLKPFYNGTYFKEFELQTFALERVGQLSPSFEGPGGRYQIQLTQSWPERTIPIAEMADEIRRRLRHQHTRHYYAYELEKYSQSQLIRNYAHWWEYMARDAPIAQVGPATLSRADFFRLFDNPTGTDYEVRWEVVGSKTSDWIEGETIMQALERAGEGRGRWIQRSRELAALSLRAERVYLVEVPVAYTISPQAASAMLLKNPIFRDLARQDHLIEFEITPRQTGPIAESPWAVGRRQARNLDRKLAQGILMTEPTPINLAQWLSEAHEGGDDTLDDALDGLRESVADSQWTEVELTIKDLGWQSNLPDSDWERLLGEVEIGEVSEGRSVDSRLRRYLLVGRRGLDLEDLAADPLQLRTLAYRAQAWVIHKAEADRIDQGELIHYRY